MRRIVFVLLGLAGGVATALYLSARSELDLSARSELDGSAASGPAAAPTPVEGPPYTADLEAGRATSARRS